MWLIQILLAYILADILSGIYHLFTDLGWNIPYQVKLFQNHHDNPQTMTFDLESILGSIPLAILAYYYYPWFFGSLAIFIALIQIPHYYTHHPDKSCGLIKILQNMRLIIIPKAHYTHHKEPFNINYCIFTGWNNFWLNPIAKKLQKFRRN